MNEPTATPDSLWQRAPRWDRPWTYPLAALLLGLPALLLDWVADDHVQVAALRGRHPTMSGSLTDLFCFAPGDVESWQALTRAGYGWWMSPELRLCFMRPLSSGLIRLDHAVFGDHPALHHLHSLGWSALTAFAVGALLHRLLPTRVAAFGALLWVLDDARWMPAGWLANRNALVATAPVLLGAIAWVRWQREGWRPGRWWAPIGLGIGLLGGEPAVAGAVLYAILAFSDLGGVARGTPLVRRIALLLPSAAVVVAWAVPWSLGGFGARNSGAYLDPLRELGAFVVAVPTRLPVLLSALLVNAPADAWATLPGIRVAFFGFGVVVALGFAVWLRAAHRRADADGPPLVHAVWLAMATALMLVPSCATPPTTRVLTLPAATGMALVGWLLVALEADVRASVRWLRRAVWAWHGPIGATAGVGYLVLAATLNHHAQGFDDGPALQGVADKVVIIPAAPDLAVGIYPPFSRRRQGLAGPAAWHTLALQRPGLRFRRTDSRTLEVESPELPLFGTMVEGLLAGPANLPVAGEVRDLGALKVHIDRADRFGVVAARFVFAEPLESARYRFLQPNETGWQTFTPPPVGATWEPPLLPTLFGVAGDASWYDAR